MQSTTELHYDVEDLEALLRLDIEELESLEAPGWAELASGICAGIGVGCLIAAAGLALT